MLTGYNIALSDDPINNDIFWTELTPSLTNAKISDNLKPKEINRQV